MLLLMLLQGCRRHQASRGAADTAMSLLQLPDECLQAVLRCHANDLKTLCNAARTHSRLCQEAAAVLNSIRVCGVRVSPAKAQQQMNSLLAYSARHSGHISSIDIDNAYNYSKQDERVDFYIHELPTGLAQLSSLRLTSVGVQLCPRRGMRGVLEALTSLTQLQLVRCTLLERPGCLAAALQQLPKLQHLKLLNKRNRRALHANNSHSAFLHGAPQLPALTHLHLSGVKLPGLESFQLLTNLWALKLHLIQPVYGVTETALAGVQQLTMLELSYAYGGPVPLFKRGALASMSSLQHLCLDQRRSWVSRTSSAAAVTQFLHELGQLTQLTHLHLISTLDPITAPAAAYTALTASSKLHTQRLEECCLPPDIWQHLLSANLQLPDLQNLRARGYQEPYALGAANILGLVSCCPNLRCLDVPQLLKEGEPAEALLPLARLTGLQWLSVQQVCDRTDDAALEVLAQLTRLTALHIGGRPGHRSQITAAGLLHLTTLRQIKGGDLQVRLFDDTYWFYLDQVSGGLHVFYVMT